MSSIYVFRKSKTQLSATFKAISKYGLNKVVTKHVLENLHSTASAQILDFPSFFPCNQLFISSGLMGL